MEMDTLWNIILSGALALIGYQFKAHMNDLKRVEILVNKTREEVAKDYVTKAEVHADINRVLDRLERLDEKLDRLMEAKR